MATHDEEHLTLALYVCTAGVEDASAPMLTICAFAEAFTSTELEEMARKLNAAKECLSVGMTKR